MGAFSFAARRKSWAINALDWRIWGLWWERHNMVGRKITLAWEKHRKLHRPKWENKSNYKGPKMGRAAAFTRTTYWPLNLSEDGQILLQEGWVDQANGEQECGDPLWEGIIKRS